MNPLVTYGDLTADAASLLRSRVTATVGRKVPPKESQTAPNLPYVLVADDGSAVQSMIAARHTLRVTVWHVDQDSAHDLAGQCLAVLLASSYGDLVACYPISAPLPAIDPDTDVDLSSFTVTAEMQGRLTSF